MRFLIVNTDYSSFIADLYGRDADLALRSSDEQLRHRFATLFGVSDFYSQALGQLGHEARDVIRPVVATAVGGIPEQVRIDSENATGILVAPGSPEALAGALERLLGDDALMTRLSENAVRDARLRFDQRQMLSSYLSWYQELAGAGEAR